MKAMTVEERRLIDDALAKGRVTRIPLGRTAIDLSKPTWRGKRRGRKPHTNAIRIIRLLAERGMTDAQIARRVGKTRKAVSNLRYRHSIPAGQPKKPVV